MCYVGCCGCSSSNSKQHSPREPCNMVSELAICVTVGSWPRTHRPTKAIGGGAKPTRGLHACFGFPNDAARCLERSLPRLARHFSLHLRCQPRATAQPNNFAVVAHNPLNCLQVSSAYKFNKIVTNSTHVQTVRYCNFQMLISRLAQIANWFLCIISGPPGRPSLPFKYIGRRQRHPP